MSNQPEETPGNKSDESKRTDEGHIDITKDPVPAESGSGMQKLLIEAHRRVMDDQAKKIQETLTNENIELLNRCKTFPIRPEDLERTGGVGESYAKARLKPSTIQLVLDGKHDKYIQEMATGAFIFGFDEEPLDLGSGKRGTSVHQQMLEGLTRTPEMQQNKGKYKGWNLAEQEGGPIHAWATATFPPKGLSQKEFERTEYYQQMKTTIDIGIMKGGLKHFFEMDDIVEKLNKYWYFDTIHGPTKNASHRIFADITEEVVDEYPELASILLYHLETLDFLRQKDGEYEELTDIQKFPADNSKSARFFRSRGCRNIGFEHNKHGLASLQIVNGEELYCVPGWMWKEGDMQTFFCMCQDIWQSKLTQARNAASKS